jgi:hypothetical protein
VLGNIPDLCCVSYKRAPSEISSDRRLGVSPGAIRNQGNWDRAANSGPHHPNAEPHRCFVTAPTRANRRLAGPRI